ncbi:YadA-like family protein [Pseudomonas pseudonitroreducens]|uniref:YadA-like family protein n=1 Tax=Pseudomonas pseudonitroreducens TaxID=2892326 RepID=UPI001F2E4ED5|nr:YadA-like family protein [Pseudomonas pseudonitroreducens]
MLKNSAGSVESHYFSINDNNTQAANYTNDGATGQNSMAAGVAAKTSGARATAVGYSASAGAIDSLAVGSGSKTLAIRSMALGSNATAAGVGSIAQGDGASATPNDSIAIGTNSQTLANDASIAIGKDSVSQSILGPASVALGNEAKALTSGSVAIGYQAVADEVNPPSVFSGNVAIGRMAHATNSLSDPSEASTALGNEAFADKGGVAVGERSNATGKLSTALGNSASATMDNSVAVGAKAKALALDAVAIGNGATAQQARSVALGVGSSTSAAVATTGIQIGDTTYAFAGVAPTSTVSIGNVGNERTLTNVAAGRISQTSTDAINGSQFYAVTQSIDDIASSPITFAGNTGSTAKLLGDTLRIQGTGSTPGSYSGANLKTQVDANGNLNLLMADNPSFASVTAGGTTTLNGSGLVITNGPSVTTAGIDAGAKQITNLAEGTAGTDAVNVDQLNDTINRSAKTHYFSVNDNGVQGGNYNNDGATGVNALAAGVGAKAAQDGAVALGAGSVTAAAVATTSTTIAGTDYAFAGAAPTSTLSVGDVGSERTITNVAAGRLNATSTDAVNGSQLFATNSAIEKVDAGAVKYDVNTDGTVNFNSITLGGDTYRVKDNGDIDYNVVDLGGDAYDKGSRSGGTRISNLAAGIDGSDAVNVDQLNIAMSNAESHYYSVNDTGQPGGNYANDGAQGKNSVAAGVNASATSEAGVALGSDSVAARDAGTAGYVPASASDEQAQAIAATTSTRGAVSVGDAANGVYRQVTGVAAGSEDSDAVNVAQLKGVVSSTNTDISNITDGKDGMFQVNNTSGLAKPKVTGKDAVAGGAGAVASGDNAVAIGTRSKATASNSVALGNDSIADRDNSVSVGSAGAERQITNLAAGTADTDGVNVAQLNKATGDLNNSINNVYSDLKHDLKKQDDTLSAGIAGALAAASLPQPYVPGASMASIGGGNYRGQNALAVGVSRISDNGKWVTKLSGNTDSQGQFGVSVGVGYQW